MSAESLRQSLADAGFAVDVEGRDRLALIRPRNTAAAREVSADRERVSAIATRHGFSHVAIEVGTRVQPQLAPPADASLPGD